MPVYRNQTPTLTQIQLLGQMRITTAQEAVAFLRAMAPLNEQVAFILQRTSLREQQAINAAALASRPAPTPVEPTPTVEPEVDKTFVPEDLSSDEGYSDTEVKDKVNKLKKANSKK